jgi:hypothetical protein
MTSDEFSDIEQLDENLRKWFKEKWVRFGPDGKIRGACARGDDSEGKPKCLPQKKAQNLGKKGRKYAASKKRREDPNPERTGKAKNVATKKKSNESINEDVGGNYLYHATGDDGLKSILQSGQLNAADGPQITTRAQTKLPTVSMTRDWGYASGSNARSQSAAGTSIGRHAVLIFDRSRIENNYKTLGTSQSSDVRGLALNPYINSFSGGAVQNTDPRARKSAKGKYDLASSMGGDIAASYNTPKHGGEFEEAIVVPKGALPIKGALVGFWVNPASSLMKDPEIMNNPLRLEKTGPNKFIKAGEKVMNEDIPFNECPKCRGPIVHESMMTEKQDACYHKVKSRYKVWPSAYASGALVQCRKKGASNWGTGGKKKNESNIMKGIVDEASGTPGGLEMFRTKGMVDLAMQQNLYKRDLEALKKAQQSEKPSYSRSSPSVAGQDSTVHLGSNPYPTEVVRDWIANRDINSAIEFMSRRNTSRQSKEFKAELIKDPKFAEAVANFFDVAAKTLEFRDKMRSNPRLSFKDKEEGLRLDGFDATRKINSVVTDYLKKFGVDKTGRRVPPTYNYDLGEAKAKQYVKPYNSPETGEQIGWVSSDGYHKKYWQMFAKASAIKHAKLNPNEVQEDYTGEFAAEVTPAINPYGGLKDRKHRGAISETPTDNPTGASGEGGWRKYKPKPAGEIDEDTAYAGGMGQGGNAGESYRKFKPKSAGTFKEDEQLDELKCWSGYTRVKGVPAGAPGSCKKKTKESAIMKGLKR